MARKGHYFLPELWDYIVPETHKRGTPTDEAPPAVRQN